MESSRTTVLGNTLGRFSQNIGHEPGRQTRFGRVTKMFGMRKGTNNNEAEFIDEANLYKRDLLQIHHQLEVTASGSIDMSTDEIARRIEKYGHSAQLGGPSTMKFGVTQIGPTLLNILGEADNSPKLKIASLRTLSCLIQNHQENQNHMLDRDLDDILVRLMATGGMTNDPVLQTWATYCLRLLIVNNITGLKKVRNHRGLDVLLSELEDMDWDIFPRNEALCVACMLGFNDTYDDDNTR